MTKQELTKELADLIWYKFRVDGEKWGRKWAEFIVESIGTDNQRELDRVLSERHSREKTKCR